MPQIYNLQKNKCGGDYYETKVDALGQRKDIDFDNSRWVLASLYNLSIIHRGALGDHPCGLFLLGRSYIELILLVITTWTEGGFCINLSSHANTPPPFFYFSEDFLARLPLHRRSHPPENGRRRLGHSQDPRGQEQGHLFSVKRSVGFVLSSLSEIE